MFITGIKLKGAKTIAATTDGNGVPYGTVLAQWTDGASATPFTVRTLSAGNCGFDSGGGVANLGPTTTKPYTGRTYSFDQHYTASTSGTNNCGNSQSIDLNTVWVDSGGFNSTGYTWLGFKGKVYFSSPINSGGKAIQRKLIWMGMGKDQGAGTPTSQVILTSDDDGTTGISLRLAYQDNGTSTSPSWSLTGNHNEVTNQASPGINGIMALSYDTWYTLEMVAKRRDSSGDNSELYIYVNNSLIFKKTNWSATDSTLCPNVGGTSQICRAFPAQNAVSTGFCWLYFGTQANRLSNNPAIIDERRNWADLSVCINGRCPTSAP